VKLLIIYLLLFSINIYAQSVKQIVKSALKDFHNQSDPATKLLILENAESQLLNDIKIWENVEKKSYHKYMALDPEKMYKATYANWLETFNKKKYRKLLTELSDGNIEILTKKNIKFIQKYRRQSHFLRMSFNMFDINHRPPAGLKDFVVHSGKLKDLIAVSKKTGFKKKTGLLIKKAKKLLELYDTVDLQKQAESIRFVTLNEFKTYFKGLSDEVVVELSKPELTVRKFHDVRKKVKEIQFALKDIIDNSPEREDLKVLFNQIDQVRSEMGDVHSMYIELKISKDIAYEKHTIKMAQSYKNAMEALVKLGEVNICSVKFFNFSNMIQ
jgi:thiaminase